MTGVQTCALPICLAVDKGREDLARGALVAKQKAEQEIGRREEAMEDRKSVV